MDRGHPHPRGETRLFGENSAKRGAGIGVFVEAMITEATCIPSRR